jgi:hypothetical protein
MGPVGRLDDRGRAGAVASVLSLDSGYSEACTGRAYIGAHEVSVIGMGSRNGWWKSMMDARGQFCALWEVDGRLSVIHPMPGQGMAGAIIAPHSADAST